MIYVQANAGVIQQLTVDAVNVSVGERPGRSDPRGRTRARRSRSARIEMQRPPHMLLAKPAIKSIKDLRGKIVSVGGPKDITRIFFERMLVPGGVDAKDVDLIYAGATFGAAAGAAVGRRRTPRCSTAPYNFHAEGGRVLPTSDEPPTCSTCRSPASSTNRNWAQSHKANALQKFLKVYTRSIAWLSEPANREEAVSLDDVGGASSAATTSTRPTTFLIKSGFLEPTGTISKAKLASVVDALKQLGDIPADFAVDRLFMRGGRHQGHRLRMIRHAHRHHFATDRTYARPCGARRDAPLRRRRHRDGRHRRLRLGEPVAGVHRPQQGLFRCFSSSRT